MLLDVSHWEIDETLNASGLREKFWLIDPSSGIKYLFKLPREETGEVWAEEISAKIGICLGYSMMDTRIARHCGRNGILLRNFIQSDNAEFYTGGDLLKTVNDAFIPTELSIYTLDNIIACLKPYRLDIKVVPMILFDALIGNQDRHCDNWGIIREDNSCSFSPLFDNGSSLGCTL
ncbi:MAG: HipA domain-containing protein [Sporolactobacillus sp.]